MNTSRDPERARARIGHWALAARVMPEAERRKVFEARLPAGGWPAKMLKVTAVDARTGELVVFDSAGKAGLVDAVGASCAVPGVWPPVTIGNRRFVDGGVRSVANADLAARYGRVVIVAPVSQAPGPSCLAPAGRRPRWPRPEPASRSCGRTARPCGPSDTTCLTCRAGQQRRRPAGPRQRPKRPRSGQSGRPMAGRPPPSRQARRRQHRAQHASRVSISQRPARPPGDLAAQPRSRVAGPGPMPYRPTALPPARQHPPCQVRHDLASGRQGRSYASIDGHLVRRRPPGRSRHTGSNPLTTGTPTDGITLNNREGQGERTPSRSARALPRFRSG